MAYNTEGGGQLYREVRSVWYRVKFYKRNMIQYLGDRTLKRVYL